MNTKTSTDIEIQVVSTVHGHDFAAVEVELYIEGSPILGDDEQPLRGVGFARRDPIDKPNPIVGFDLATARAIQNLGQRAVRRVNGRVKQLDDITAQRARRKQVESILDQMEADDVKRANKATKKANKVKTATA